MNKRGYALKEVIILCAILALAFGVAITRVSYAYQNIADESVVTREDNNTIKLAAETYAKAHEDTLNKDKENFIFGKDLIEEGYLIQTEDFDYHETKIKITYNNDNKKYIVEIVE